MGEGKQGLQGTHVALQLALAAQHFEGLETGLVGGCFVLEDLLEIIDGDGVVSLLLILPGPDELVHGLQSVPLLVVLGVLDIALEGLDDSMAQLQIGLQLQRLRVHLFPPIEQYFKEVRQPCPGSLDGLHLGNDDPLLQLLVMGYADCQWGYQMPDASQKLLDLALALLFCFESHHFLLEHLPQVGRVRRPNHFKFRDGCPEDLDRLQEIEQVAPVRDGGDRLVVDVRVAENLLVLGQFLLG